MPPDRSAGHDGCNKDRGRTSTVTKGGPATGMTIMHTVQEGENLYRIARKYGTSVQAIQQANGITDPAMITVGQKLIIPNLQATTEPEPTATPTATPTPFRPSPTVRAHRSSIRRLPKARLRRSIRMPTPTRDAAAAG